MAPGPEVRSVEPQDKPAVAFHLAAPRWVIWVCEATLACLALLTLWLLAQPDEEPWVQAADLTLWPVFVFDYGIRFARAGDLRAFVRGNVLDLIAILPLDFLRIARVVRFLRLIRALALLWRVHKDVRILLATNGLGLVLSFTGGIILLSGFALAAVEPDIGTIADGLWWSVVTVTTVGYGDISPATVAGGQRGDGNPTIEHIKSRLDRWDDLSTAECQEISMLLQALADKGPPRTPQE